MTVVFFAAVVGPTLWNSLGNDLRDPDFNIARALVACSRRVCFSLFSVLSALEALYCDKLSK